MSRQELLWRDGELHRTAVFSPCRTWRYTLERCWDAGGASLLFVLLNPSTADAEKDDPTNRRGMAFARRWGFGSLVFVNLFAFRSPHPKVMKEASEPVGPENDRHIVAQAAVAGRIVLAWGNHGSYLGRDLDVLDMLADYDLWCFGRTNAGQPKHPLYLRADTEIEPWKR